MTIDFLPLSPLLGDTIPLPTYATPGSAAMDLRACLEAPTTIPPGGRALIPTGFALAVPAGFAAFLFARSGLAVREGICLSNGVGVIDSDYRGQVCVGLCNLSDRSYTIQPGERIAQMAILPVEQASIRLVDTLPDTNRGSGGFGSTGKD